jgi:hypothetical protein
MRNTNPFHQSFTDVPVTEKGVDTLAFLEASQGVVGLFGAHHLVLCDSGSKFYF